MPWNFNDLNTNVWDPNQYIVPNPTSQAVFGGSEGGGTPQSTGGNIPWTQLLGGALGGLGAYFGQEGAEKTGTLSQNSLSPLNPFAQTAAQNIQNMANIGSSLAIPGPTGNEANYYNSILPILLAQSIGNFGTNQGQLQTIAGQGPQSYLPQNLGNMQALQNKGANAFYPQAQLDQAGKALQGLEAPARQNLANQLQQNYGKLLGPTTHGRMNEITQEAGSQLEAQLAQMKQQQANTNAGYMSTAQQQVPALMNQISGYQQNANQFAPQTQVNAIGAQTSLNQLIPYFGQLFGQGTNTYLDRLKQGINLYNPNLGLGTQGTGTSVNQATSQGESSGNPWWVPLATGAANSLLNTNSGGGTGWNSVFSGLGDLGKTIGGWFS